MKMNHTKLVSIDMFRTLVDIRDVEQVIWRIFLKDKYTASLAKECATQFGKTWFNNLPRHKFLSAKAIFRNCFNELFSNIGINFDPVEGTKLWAQQLSISKPFGDSIPFLNAVGKKYTICLASDADDDMLGTLKQMYNFDCIFTSERLGLYKTNADGRFFSAVVKHYGMSPEEIIHIGDSRLEIVGASKIGITTCWLNRAGLKWSYDIKPTYEFGSLIEAALVLGVTIDSNK